MRIKLHVKMREESFTKEFKDYSSLRDFVDGNMTKFMDPAEECSYYDPFKGSCGECQGCKNAEETERKDGPLDEDDDDDDPLLRW